MVPPGDRASAAVGSHQGRWVSLDTLHSRMPIPRHSMGLDIFTHIEP